MAWIRNILLFIWCVSPVVSLCAADKTKPFTGAYVTVPDLLSNLRGMRGKRHFLKLSLTLEAKTKEDAKIANDAMPHIVDQFCIYLRALRLDDLEGAEGIFLLKKQLLERANAVLGNVSMEAVLFRQLLVQ